MLAGSREAPTTATARGSSIGRSEAAVAQPVARLRRRRRLSADGVSDSCDVDAAAGRLRSDLEAGVAKHLEHRACCRRASSPRSAWKPCAAAIAASRSSSIGAEPLALEAIVDGERHFGDARRAARCRSRPR